MHLRASQTPTNNVLFIVADDFATDGLRLYNTNAAAHFPPMPTVECLASNGLLFRNAYGYPTCSPSRCTILSGRYGFRTGIGYALANPAGPSLSASEFTIPDALNAAGVMTNDNAQIGKWHLSFGVPDQTRSAVFLSAAASSANSRPTRIGRRKWSTASRTVG